MREKKIFLQTNQNCDRLVEDIKSLGGLISQFLTKRVDFVVTDQFDSPTKMSDELLVSRSGSRAKMLLASALNSPTHHKKTLQEKGREFGFKVFSVLEFKAKINKMIISKKRDYSLADDREHCPQEIKINKDKKTFTRGLRAPFIKVEDHSRRHSPTFKEFDSWPSIDFDSPTVWKGGNRRQSENSLKQERGEIRKFCECCQCFYTDLNSHLESKEHRSFAQNDGNYKAVDKLIKRGRSLSEFVEDTVKRRTDEKA